jgi:hypothetical protein
MNENIEWLIGLVLIVIFAQSRFNTPKSNRSSTTVYRYYFAFFCYCLSLCLLYLLLGGGISASPVLYDLLTKGAEGGAENNALLAGGPLLSALILTSLLPNFPVLSKIDDWLRVTFQDIGHIPKEARELSGNMRRSNFAVPERQRDEIRRYLADFPETDIRFRPDNSTQSEWTQVTSLWLEVRSWADKKKYSGFLESFKSDYRQIETGYEKLCVKALKCFRWMSDYDDPEETTFHLLKECQKDFQDQLIVLKKDLSNYIARGVLTCEITGKERRAKLAEIGFYDIADDHSPLNAHQVVTIGFIVFLFMFFGNLFFRGTPLVISRTILISMMVATIYGLSILLAIYLKVVWPFADIRRVGQRPVASYVVSGLLAVVLAFFISLTFKFVWFCDFMKALEEIKVKYPWFLMSFTVAATLSYLCDNGVLSKKPLSPWLRWLESIACGGVLMVASYVALSWLSQIQGLPTDRIPLVKVFISCGIGMAVGYFVPHWYRSLPPETNADREMKGQIAWDAPGRAMSA